jgi:RNA polymerase sigma factor (sigma-70 family)
MATPSHESLLASLELRSEQLENLNQILNALPLRQQEAINLRYYNNFSNEEVAEIMGVNYQSACKFIYMALKKLRENLRVAVSSFLVFVTFF